MAAGVTGRRHVLRCLPRALALGLLPQVPLAAAGPTTKPNGEPDALPMTDSLLSRIDRLKSINLPDEWFPAKGATLTERFEAAFQAMPPGPTKPASAAELVAQYANDGKPFQHIVWFNRPLRCRLCRAGGADGFRVIASVRNNLAVTISAEEMHLARAHQQAFSDAKRAELGRVLAGSTAGN